MNDEDNMVKYGDGIWIVNVVLLVALYIGLGKMAFIWSLLLATMDFILAWFLFFIAWFDIRGYGEMHRYLAIRFFALTLLIILISFGTCMVEFSKTPSW